MLDRKLVTSLAIALLVFSGVFQLLVGDAQSIPSQTSSGVEILFGGDYVTFNVSVWENEDSSWYEDYSFEATGFPDVGFIGDIVVIDIDGDGENETVLANSGGIVQIFEHVDGRMESSHNITHPGGESNCQTLAIADLDNDGGQDLEILVTSTNFGIQSCVFKMIEGIYKPVLNISSVIDHAGSMACAAGDVDNDGDLEFIVTEEFPSTSSDVLDGLCLLRLFQYDGGIWDNVASYSFTIGFPHNFIFQVQITDVDNDNLNEIYVNPENEPVQILEYNGGVLFRTWQAPFHSADKGASIVGDITNDGLADIVVADGIADTIYVFETNNSNIVNTFNLTLTGFENRGLNNMAIGDLDGDGQNEWVFVYYNSTTLPWSRYSIYRNNTLLQKGNTPFIYGTTVAIGNYDNDDYSIASPTTTTDTDTIPPPNGSGPLLPIELLALAIGIPVILIVMILVVRRRKGT